MVAGGAPPRRFLSLSQFFMDRESDDGPRVMGYQDKADAGSGEGPLAPAKVKAPEVPVKDKLAKQEGMTTVANVVTVAVPIGPGIKSVSDILDFAPGHPNEKKKKQKRTSTVLLRVDSK
jgi:hypothetical protein